MSCITMLLKVYQELLYLTRNLCPVLNNLQISADFILFWKSLVRFCDITPNFVILYLIVLCYS